MTGGVGAASRRFRPGPQSDAHGYVPPPALRTRIPSRDQRSGLASCRTKPALLRQFAGASSGLLTPSSTSVNASRRSVSLWRSACTMTLMKLEGSGPVRELSTQREAVDGYRQRHLPVEYRQCAGASANGRSGRVFPGAPASATLYLAERACCCGVGRSECRRLVEVIHINGTPARAYAWRLRPSRRRSREG